MGEAWIIDSCSTPRGIGKGGRGSFNVDGGGMAPAIIVERI
jgi:hypothetical protein